jgi:hypothetical protein
MSELQREAETHPEGHGDFWAGGLASGETALTEDSSPCYALTTDKRILHRHCSKTRRL